MKTYKLILALFLLADFVNAGTVNCPRACSGSSDYHSCLRECLSWMDNFKDESNRISTDLVSTKPMQLPLAQLMMDQTDFLSECREYQYLCGDTCISFWQACSK